jgi:hypothetical protein
VIATIPPPTVEAQGRVRVEGAPATSTLSICDAARQARARNSPAAPGLEASCDLATKGAAIAAQDPLATALRNQQPDGPAREGFDIGMGAAAGDTLPGPGKQRIHDSLPQAKQAGFSTAVSFSLERNRNAGRAAKGAAIAAADPVVAEARNAESDVFFRLGFDIASAIFGDPARGAEGNTATGPGSLAVRDSLSAAGQKGFNAAVAFHLAHSYRP